MGNHDSYSDSTIQTKEGVVRGTRSDEHPLGDNEALPSANEPGRTQFRPTWQQVHGAHLPNGARCRHSNYEVSEIGAGVQSDHSAPPILRAAGLQSRERTS